ncbi:MAG: hypothetical protein JF586_02165 [Burkholderiales bacterium]|nr:hypothetical protein [Burkholderiales bacterium]
MRAAPSALLGALAAVAGWAALSLLAQRQPALAPEALAAVPVAPNTLFAADRANPPAASPRAPEVRVDGLPAAATTATPARAVVPGQGQVLVHGMPTALHAGSADGPSAPARPAVALPSGAPPEDAVVNPAGLVALTRSATPPAGDAAAPAPARPPLVSRTP